MRRFERLQIILTTSAHYNKTKKALRLGSRICFGMGIETLGDSCELAPAVPSPPPYQLHRDGHVPLASSAFRLDCLPANLPPPQSIKMRRLTPTPHRVFKRLVIASGVGQGRGEEQVKSGKFNWSHRQF